MTETIGERLKSLRKKHHFTQKQIADYLEFQQGQIAKLENNQRKLKVSSLEKLCELYNCDEEYILEGIEDNYNPKIAFRSNVKNLNLNTIADMNKIIKNIEFLSDITSNIDESSIEQNDNYLELSEKANMCRKLWGIDELTPIDIFRVVLEKVKNVTICFFNKEDNLSGSSIKIKDQNIIFINSKHSLGRQRFTLAHEIYHLKYDEEFGVCDLDHGNDSVEEKADRFASFLLMSNAALFNYELENNIKEWDLDKVIQAEQYFQISHKAMLRKLTDLGRISEETAEEYLPSIMYNAQSRGYDLKLYNPFSEDENLILGNYINMVKKAYDNDCISKSKKNELLIDGFCESLVYNDIETDDLIE